MDTSERYRISEWSRHSVVRQRRACQPFLRRIGLGYKAKLRRSLPHLSRCLDGRAATVGVEALPGSFHAIIWARRERCPRSSFHARSVAQGREAQRREHCRGNIGRPGAEPPSLHRDRSLGRPSGPRTAGGGPRRSRRTGAVLNVDETGFPKKGTKSLRSRGSIRALGRVDSCQIGVFANYASSRGHTLTARRLYLRAEWANDCDRRTESRVPEDVVFRTKPELALEMVQDAAAAEVRFRWVGGNEVYGDQPEFAGSGCWTNSTSSTPPATPWSGPCNRRSSHLSKGESQARGDPRPSSTLYLYLVS